jgi:SAM-dependent methyltransferase
LVPDVTANYYEKYWADEGYKPVRSGPDPSLRRLFETYVRSGDECLDVGCGDGGTAGLWLVEHSLRYLGVDVSTAAVELARTRGLDAMAIADAADLPLPSASFDVVVCSEVLEHLFDPLVATQEIRRVLRPGGRLIATVPNATHWRDRLDMALGRWTPRGDDKGTSEPWRSPHIRFFSRKSLAAMLSRSGFSGIQTGGRTDVPLLTHVPLVRRSVRARRPSRVYLHLVDRVPSLVAPGLWAVAWSDE